MIAIEEIDRFIRELDQARSVAEIRAIVLRSMQSLGYSYFAYMTNILPDGRQHGFYVGNYPASWVARYRAERYSSEDPVMPYRLRTVVPYTWGEIKQQTVLTERQKQIFGEAGEFDLRSGAVVPLHGPGAMSALFAVGGDRQPETFARDFFPQRHQLQLMASYLHDRLIPFMPQGPSMAPPKITARESEILTWTARGKTSWEISTILTISDETVRHHLKSVCRKLGVSNKTHATSLCIAQGLLRP